MHGVVILNPDKWKNLASATRDKQEMFNVMTTPAREIYPYIHNDF